MAKIRVSMTSLILENADISENKYIFFLPGLRTNLITQDASSDKMPGRLSHEKKCLLSGLYRERPRSKRGAKLKIPECTSKVKDLKFTEHMPCQL